jgi:hypothetical protein
MFLILDIVFLGHNTPQIAGGKNKFAIFNISKPKSRITKKRKFKQFSIISHPIKEKNK